MASKKQMIQGSRKDVVKYDVHAPRARNAWYDRANLGLLKDDTAPAGKPASAALAKLRETRVVPTPPRPSMSDPSVFDHIGRIEAQLAKMDPDAAVRFSNHIQMRMTQMDDAKGLTMTTEKWNDIIDESLATAVERGRVASGQPAGRTPNRPVKQWIAELPRHRQTRQYTPAPPRGATPQLPPSGQQGLVQQVDAEGLPFFPQEQQTPMPPAKANNWWRGGGARALAIGGGTLGLLGIGSQLAYANERMNNVQPGMSGPEALGAYYDVPVKRNLQLADVVNNWKRGWGQ
jgi:hypothetical protein